MTKLSVLCLPLCGSVILQLSDLLPHPLIVITLCCSDTVKLTAMFVAKNGTSFLDKLMMREQVRQAYLFPTYVHAWSLFNSYPSLMNFIPVNHQRNYEPRQHRSATCIGTVDVQLITAWCSFSLLFQQVCCAGLEPGNLEIVLMMHL